MADEMMPQERDAVTLAGGTNQCGLKAARMTHDRCDDRAGRRLGASGAKAVRRQPDDTSRPVGAVRMGVDPSLTMRASAGRGGL